MRRVFGLLVLTSVVLVAARPSSAQVKYVDEAGSTHYAQNESMVPEQYRSKLTGLGALPSVRASGSQQESGASVHHNLSPSGPTASDKEYSRALQDQQKREGQVAQQRARDDAARASRNACVGSKSWLAGQQCF